MMAQVVRTSSGELILVDPEVIPAGTGIELANVLEGEVLGLIDLRLLDETGTEYPRDADGREVRP